MKVCHSREIINPIFPTLMEGYNDASNRMNQSASQLKDVPDGLRTSFGQREDLFLDTLMFEDNGTELVWFTLDILDLQFRNIEYIRERVSKGTGVDPMSLSISCSHTHNSPLASYGMDGDFPVSEEYWEMITDKMIYSVKYCKRHLEEIESVVFDSHRINGFYNNRNRPGEYYNDNVYELTIKNALGCPVVKIYNMVCHPTILGASNYLVTNDFFSVTRNYVQAYTGYPVMLFNGEAGDVSPRKCKRGVDYNEVVRYGVGIGSQIMDPYKPVKLDASKLTLKWVKHHVEYNPKENEFLVKQAQAFRDELATLDPASDRYKRITTLYLKDCEKKLEHDHLVCDSECIVADFGSFRFVGCPCEVDSELGKILREIDDKPTFMVAYCNGSNGYAVNKDEFGVVFETYISRYPLNAADEMIEEVVKAAKEL